jgi:hypothetical protein
MNYIRSHHPLASYHSEYLVRLQRWLDLRANLFLFLFTDYARPRKEGPQVVRERLLDPEISLSANIHFGLALLKGPK